jgi:hypothetical protein
MHYNLFPCLWLIATNHEKNKKRARKRGMNYMPQPLPLIVIVCNETPKNQKKLKRGQTAHHNLLLLSLLFATKHLKNKN